MSRCVCKDQKTLRFTSFFGFDYVVVLGGMVAASTCNGHDIFMIFYRYFIIEIYILSKDAFLYLGFD